jgi:hypothetical protein
VTSRASPIVAWAASAALAAVVAAAVLRSGAEDRAALAEARPSIERFLAAIDARRFGDLRVCATGSFVASAAPGALASVLDSADAVLGERATRGEPEARLEGPGRLIVSILDMRERADATITLEAALDAAGRWRVARCATTTPAFAWVLR